MSTPITLRRIRDALPVRQLGAGLCLVAFAAIYLSAGLPVHVAAWSLGLAAAIGLAGIYRTAYAAVLTVRGVRRGVRRGRA